MKKFDLPLWTDSLFFLFCTWLITLCVLRFYRITFWLAVIIALLFSLPIAILFFYILYRRRKKKFLLTQDKEDKEKLLLHLALSKKAELTALFKDLFEEENVKIKFLFQIEPLSADEIAKHLKTLPKNKTLHIVCNALTPDAQALARSFGIKITGGDQCYALLKENNRLPEKYICAEKKRTGVKEKLKISLHKKNSRAFFISGAALLILSLISFFPLYYVISGSILLTVSLAVRIFGYS